MKKSRNITTVVFIIAMFLFTLFLISCGGGGGSTGDGGTPTISYTGIKDEASIGDDNATDLTTESYTNGSLGSAMSDIAASQTENSEHVYTPRMLKVSNVLKDSLFKVDLTSRSTGTFAGAVSQVTDTIAGSCGGSASYTISVNDETGAFSSSFTYNNYCEGGVIISGSVDFSGQFDVATETFLTFEFSFNNLSTTLGGDSVTVKGNMSFNMTGSPIILTMTILIKDSSINRVYWVKDYRLAITEGVGYADIDISGRFYHPEHGYVTLSTEQVLRLYDLDDYPSSGILLITGKTGAEGGKTKARITFHSSSTYQVEADTNGDGLYDDYGVSNWADL